MKEEYKQLQRTMMLEYRKIVRKVERETDTAIRGSDWGLTMEQIIALAKKGIPLRRVAECYPWTEGAISNIRWVSLEPLLEPIDMTQYLRHFLSWVVVGGESGPGARRCEPAWIESIVDQCRAAKVPCFVKQLGQANGGTRGKNSVMSEWPPTLRVRQYPAAVDVTSCLP